MSAKKHVYPCKKASFNLRVRHRLVVIIFGPRMVSGFVSEKPNAVHNAKDHLTAAVVEVQILRGLSHFEMTLTSDLEAVGINGRLRHTITLEEIKSIASALLKRKEAHSAKGPDTRVPIGVVPHLGRILFEMTRTAEVAAVDMLGRLNLELQLL